MTFRTAPLLVLATGLGLAACTTTPSAEVTRFHLSQPTPSDTIRVVPAPEQVEPGAAIPLEFRSYAAIVARDLAAHGFRPVDSGPSAYVAMVRIEQTTRTGIPRQSPFSIGIGGGTGGGGFGGGVGGGGGGGVGGGITLPVGRARNADVRVNELAVQIRRQSDNTAFWEGRAVAQIGAGDAGASLTAAVPKLSRALFAGFPGISGQTVTVRLR